MKKRSYASERRRTQSDNTRRKLLAAARRRLMSRRGLEHFSLEAVAQHAKVTRLTIYNQFGSRLGLLEAVYDDLAARGEIASRMAAAFRRDDPEACLDAIVDAFVEFWNSQRVLLRRLRSMAAVDPAFASAKQRDKRRRAAMQVVVSRWRAHDDHLRDDGEAVADVLTALTSFEIFDALAGTQANLGQIKATLGVLARAALARPR